MEELVRCIKACASKAARIAQLFRAEHDLFLLLVEEKDPEHANPRFARDFKTLADVLVQEAICADLAAWFPSLAANIRGEEQSSFQNGLGERIHVKLASSPADTAALLTRVLDGRDRLARLLSDVVHAPLDAPRPEKADTLPSLGVWIDPIDSTAEYIEGKYEEEDGFRTYGLSCVCVLIGVYDLRDGSPVAGVVNQPFFRKLTEPDRWEDASVWAGRGIAPAFDPRRRIPARESKVVVLSNSESEVLRRMLETRYTVVYAAGSGYKSLMVTCSAADLYVLSQGNTYFWDTCGPHAILASQGGGIVKFRESLDTSTEEDVKRNEIKYSITEDTNGIEAFQNSSGIIAYRKPGDVIELVRFLRDCDYVCT